MIFGVTKAKSFPKATASSYANVMDIIQKQIRNLINFKFSSYFHINIA